MPSLIPDRQTSLSLTSDRPRAEKKPCLIVVSGPESGRRIDLDQDELVIGRSNECRLCVPDDSVSRRHAVLTRALGRWMVLDLQSTNGTFVNEARVERAELSDGDLLSLGKVSAKYVENNLELAYIQHVLSVATTDALTGFFNRGHFDERLRTELSASLQSGNPCSLILFDIDHFKRINDAFGHQAGDTVLQHVTAVARRLLERDEQPFRVGGEEFVLLLPGTPYSLAMHRAERIRHAVEVATCRVGDSLVSATLSLGVAELAPGDTSERIYQRADAQLYLAKRTGRNRVR